MPRLVSAILSVVIVLHAVLGCCWHHARCTEFAARPHGHSKHECCRHHDSRGEDGKIPHDSSEDCHEASCVFVRGETSRVGDLAGEMALDVAMDDGVTLTCSQSVVSRRLDEARLSHVPLGRLHLRLGVLLI
jgi:hypothetical protein